MNIFLITCLVLIAAAIGLLVLLRGNRRFQKESALENHLQLVDMAAFLNLVSPEERAYLRENLSRDDFRTSQRQRIRAAIEYVFRIMDNSKILIRIAETAVTSSNPEILAAGRRMLEAATTARALSVLTILRLYLEFLFPQLDLNVAAMISKYNDMQRQFDRFRQMDYLTALRAENPIS